MSTSLASYAPRFIGQHLMIHLATAAAIANGLGGPTSPDPTPEASRFRGAPTAGGARYRVEAGAALLTIEGPLCNRGTWLGSSWGGACYEGLSAQLAAIMADGSVDRIVLDINTPGGEVAGCFEFAAELRTAAARKPVTAFVNGMACSAGYAIASAANRIVVTPSAMVGSIGVVMMHVDQSRALDRAGLTATLISAGGRKVERSSLSPLSDPARQAMQRDVDAFYSLFCDTVARNRGLTSAAVRATEAGTFIGAAGVSAGLADAIGTIDTALAGRPTGFPAARTIPPAPIPVPRPAGAANSVPAPAAPPTRPPPNAPRQRTAAEMRALQLDACVQVWRNGGKAAAAELGAPADVLREAGAIIQGEASASWDGVVADANARSGSTPSPAARPDAPAPAPQGNHGWDDVVNGMSGRYGIVPGKRP